MDLPILSMDVNLKVAQGDLDQLYLRKQTGDFLEPGYYVSMIAAQVIHLCLWHRLAI